MWNLLTEDVAQYRTVEVCKKRLD